MLELSVVATWLFEVKNLDGHGSDHFWKAIKLFIGGKIAKIDRWLLPYNDWYLFTRWCNFPLDNWWLPLNGYDNWRWPLHFNRRCWRLKRDRFFYDLTLPLNRLPLNLLWYWSRNWNYYGCWLLDKLCLILFEVFFCPLLFHHDLKIIRRLNKRLNLVFDFDFFSHARLLNWQRFSRHPTLG